MTFNQFCAGKRFDIQSRIALEAIWNALIGGGAVPAQAKHLLEDMLDCLDLDGPSLCEECRDAAACKYFDENPTIPARFSK